MMKLDSPRFRSGAAHVALFAAIVLCAAPGTVYSANDCTGKGSIRLVNGKIHTMDQHDRVVSSVLIDNGEFAAVGGQDAGAGLHVNVIGNVIHDIHPASGVYQPGSGFANAAVMLHGGFNRVVINNTFHDVDAGFNSPASNGNVSLVN